MHRARRVPRRVSGGPAPLSNQSENTMKLYYFPGACSLSPHIVAREAGIPLQLVKVDLSTKRTEHGEDFHRISPKGAVPVLELDSGERLTEGPAITQYLADLKPESGLVPANGTKFPPLGTMNSFHNQGIAAA